MTPEAAMQKVEIQNVAAQKFETIEVVHEIVESEEDDDDD